MLKIKAPKPKTKPPIELSDDEFSSTSSSSSLPPSPYLTRKDKDIGIEEVEEPSLAYIKNRRKRNYPLLSSKKEN